MLYARKRRGGEGDETVCAHTQKCTHRMYTTTTHCALQSVSKAGRSGGRRNDAFPVMKAESLYRTEQLDYANIMPLFSSNGHRYFVKRFNCPSFSFAWLYLPERGIRSSVLFVRPLVASFFRSSAQFAGEDVETSRTFSTETLCRPASLGRQSEKSHSYKNHVAVLIS